MGAEVGWVVMWREDVDVQSDKWLRSWRFTVVSVRAMIHGYRQRLPPTRAVMMAQHQSARATPGPPERSGVAPRPSPDYVAYVTEICALV